MRRALALALIVSLSYMPAAQAAGPLLASAIRAVSELDPTGGQTAQQVHLLGVGAEVQVKLTAGNTLKGVIASIGAQTFELTLARDRASRAVAYADVAEVRFARTTYRAEGRPDAAEAARVAAGLVGHHVAVAWRTGRRTGATCSRRRPITWCCSSIRRGRPTRSRMPTSRRWRPT